MPTTVTTKRTAMLLGMRTVKWRRFIAMRAAITSGTNTDTARRTIDSTPVALSEITTSLPKAGRNP